MQVLVEVVLVVGLVVIPLLAIRVAWRFGQKPHKPIWPPEGTTPPTRADRKTGYTPER